jgi:hypothetical protein
MGNFLFGEEKSKGESDISIVAKLMLIRSIEMGIIPERIKLLEECIIYCDQYPKELHNIKILAEDCLLDAKLKPLY